VQTLRLSRWSFQSWVSQDGLAQRAQKKGDQTALQSMLKFSSWNYPSFSSEGQANFACAAALTL
jgi:hypothetical protein